MRSLILLSLAPLALANDVFMRALLQPRQGSDAFKPTGIFDFDCQYPCGKDWCVHPESGDTCCAEGYACGGGSFCLTQGYCCPDGDDPATCARGFSITLSAGFKASQTVSVSLASSTAAPVTSSSRVVAPSPSTSSKSSSTPTAAAPITPTSTPSSSKAPLPTTATNATLVSPSTTATSKSTPGSTTVVQFTGGAVRVAIDGVVGAIVFGGAVGLLI